MNIDSIAAISDATAPVLSGNVASNSQANISNWIDGQLNELNDQIQVAEDQVKQLAVGQTDNLHQVMISLEKAKLSFELTMQVRNKLLEGYQEIMRMQI